MGWLILWNLSLTVAVIVLMRELKTLYQNAIDTTTAQSEHLKRHIKHEPKWGRDARTG